MKNVDFEVKTLAQARADLMDALRTDDEQKQTDALNAVFDAIAAETKTAAKAEARLISAEAQDDTILMNRGTRRVLTSEEKKYFNAVVEKEGFEGIDQVFPVTIVESVLENIKKEHPVLSRIDLVTVDGIIKYVYAKPNAQLAYWGDICADIRQLILNGFEVANLNVSKLSGFVVMCKGFIELGPNWLATYIVRTLEEIMSDSLEHAVVNGAGKFTFEGVTAIQPVGMTKSLFGVIDGFYKDKTPVVINEITPTTLAGIRGSMSAAKMDKGAVAVLVHPNSYWTKLFPTLSFQDQSGKWVLTNLPTGEEIIQSYAVPEDRLIFGVLKNYFMGVASNVKITKYTETLAIEDLDLWIAKFFGNGMPKDANAFFVADISGIAGATLAPLDEDAEVVEVPGE